jgi:hypothetical protein
MKIWKVVSTTYNIKNATQKIHTSFTLSLKIYKMYGCRWLGGKELGRF